MSDKSKGLTVYINSSEIKKPDKMFQKYSSKLINVLNPKNCCYKVYR